MGPGRNRVSGRSGCPEESSALDTIASSPDISVPWVEGLAGLAVAVVWGVCRLGDPPSSKLMPWLDRHDEDGQPSPMPVSESVLRSTVMAFVTTAKTPPPMPVRAPPEGKWGAASSAGAPADAPKADAAAARPMGGYTEALQSEMDAALDLCRSLPHEHVPKAAANMGLHLPVLVPMIAKDKTGA